MALPDDLTAEQRGALEARYGAIRQEAGGGEYVEVTAGMPERAIARVADRLEVAPAELHVL